jgi:hypothetical protein
MNTVTKTTLSVFALLGVLAASPETARALQINFGNLTGASVQFDGTSGTFSFNPGSGGNQFAITTVGGGAGDSVGDLGSMSGTFTIGTISSFLGVQTAPVTGTGSLTIHGGGNDLTAALVWNTIATMGAGGLINVNGALNLTSITYSGLQTDLLGLSSTGVGTETISFQFAGLTSLTDLTTSGTSLDTSFSGSLSAVSTGGGAPVPDGGTTMALLGTGLVGVGGLRRRLGRHV